MVHSISHDGRREGGFEVILTLSHDQWHGITNSKSMWGPSCTCHNGPNNDMRGKNGKG